MPIRYRRVLFHEDAEAHDSGGRTKMKPYLEKGTGDRGVNHPDDDGSQDHTVLRLHRGAECHRLSGPRRSRRGGT
jgi:hypothetical protein